MQFIIPKTENSHTEVWELKNHIGETVKMHGTVYKIREMSGFAFVILSVKSGTLQCVYSEEYSQFPLNSLRANMAVTVSGTVVSEPRSRSGFEVRLIDFEPLSVPEE